MVEDGHSLLAATVTRQAQINWQAQINCHVYMSGVTYRDNVQYDIGSTQTLLVLN